MSLPHGPRKHTSGTSTVGMEQKKEKKKKSFGGEHTEKMTSKSIPHKVAGPSGPRTTLRRVTDRVLLKYRLEAETVPGSLTS